MQNDPCAAQTGPQETPLPEANPARQTVSPGALTPEEIAAIGRRMFGRRAWRSALARSIGVNPSSVSRWASGVMRIDPAAATALRLLDVKHRQRKLEQRALRP